jgi:hypothetical protein
MPSEGLVLDEVRLYIPGVFRLQLLKEGHSCSCLGRWFVINVQIGSGCLPNFK